MEPTAAISVLGEDCLLPQGRSCLGCFIDTKDATLPPSSDSSSSSSSSEPGVSLKMAGDPCSRGAGDYDTCPIVDIHGIQCMTMSVADDDAGSYGDQLLCSDQLLSFPLPPSKPLSTHDKKVVGGDRTTSDCDNSDTDIDQAAKNLNLYEGLLLDKCSNGEEAELQLLANSAQDWGYIESFISESKMELLDLCSQKELSGVNLFSEEDVDNYMFDDDDDDDDDSTLSSDVCSLKIRYESFQDNMREKTNVLQEETQFNFFPSVLVNNNDNCPSKKEDGGTTAEEDEEEEEEEDLVLSDEGDRKVERCNSPGEGCSPDYSPKMDYVVDSSDSAEESGDYSEDDSSSSTRSSVEMPPDGSGGGKPKRRPLTKKGSRSSSSNHLNYGLRAKRKVRYSEDYLYDVDSIEGERNAEKRDKQAPGVKKEERDDDWCPKKQRKSSNKNKEPPVIIKYIIINRFKGEKHMSVKLFKTDPTATTVSLDTEAMSKYEQLAPLKCFWQEQEREREERLKQALGDKPNVHPNGRHRHRPFNSSPPKRKYKFANRFRIQRIHATVEQSPNRQGSSVASVTEEGSSSSGTKDGSVQPTGRPLPPVPALGLALALDNGGDVTHTHIAAAAARPRKSRLQQQKEEKLLGCDKVVRLRKFKSEARLRSEKLEEAVQRAAEGTATHTLLDNQSTDAAVVFAMASGKPTTSEPVGDDGVSVIPGGYLQTLLDGSDSSSNASAISYYPQQNPQPQQQQQQQYAPLGLTIEDKQFSSLQMAQSCVLSPPSESELQQSPQFVSLQMAQSCVLSPPSESELQQSPQNCTNFTQMWHSQLCHNQQFGTDISGAPPPPPSSTNTIQAYPKTTTAMPIQIPMSAEDMAMAGYTQVNLEGNNSRVLYEKNYLPEQVMQQGAADGDYQVAFIDAGQLQFQRGTLNTDHGRLTSFDSMGSLSVASSSYSSMSVKSCEKEGGEEDGNGGGGGGGGETFLAHCSPKVLVQQSLEAITPLRESTDLLDISNFTPDKFRHSSLSELSPPETPNLSPQVKGREMKIIGGGKALNYQDVVVSDDMTWNCNMMEQVTEHVNVAPYATGDNHQFQMHVYNNNNTNCAGVGVLDSKDAAACGAGKGTKSKKRNGGKQAGGEGGKKPRAPKVPKGDKAKAPRQNSRSSKKLKAHLEEKAGKGKADAGAANDVAAEGECPPGMNWPDANGHGGNIDDQREFEEPSNILSNIVSGMAEVQRFMMASIEPLWGSPVANANVCLAPDANSLKLKTLKILAGTTPDPKKKGGAAGAGSAKGGRKGAGKGAKNQAAKFNPFFPQLALGCNMFDKPNLCIPGINGPAHKKMYRHKTSAKFPRIETIKGGKRAAEREPNKDMALMTSFEKLRKWIPPSCRLPLTAWLKARWEAHLSCSASDTEPET
ncbi:neurite extension and migration factor [Engraulis encrasicolus]|uniref:neurite extension and migration factor n=1 Tax=Engraulis encrasicolus TaxID=184585 RepID=UPI002FD3CEA5